MNRDIKFRAWDIDRKTMIYDAIVLESNLIKHRASLDNSKNVVWLQYTGIKEIYEGDILRSINHYEGKEPFYLYHIVKYDTNYSGFMAIHKDNKENTTGNGNIQLWVYIKNISNFEIIGNIYENPNLLK